MGFAGLVAVGAVNVVTWFRPDLKPEHKFAISFVAALVVTFIPPELGNILLNKVKIALEASLGVSGMYKISQKAGGK